MNVCFLPSTWMRNQLLWEGNRVNQIKINEHWMLCDKLPASKKKNELYSLDSQQHKVMQTIINMKTSQERERRQGERAAYAWCVHNCKKCSYA